MPRLPRLRKGVPAAPQAPEASTAEPETRGEPPAPATEEPRADAAPATSGDPLGAATPSGETGGDGDPPPATTSGDPLGAATPSRETGGDGDAPPATTSGDPLGGAAAPAPSGDAPAGAVEPATAVAPAANATVVEAAPADAAPAGDETVVEAAPADAAPGFRARARIRRRLRYLRRYRELAFRDLGGLLFDLHRFGRERPDLVAQKLGGLATVDRELRALETALRDRQDVTQLREVGIAACPRCQTLHDTDANFCPGCGSALRGAVVRDAAPVTVTPAEPGAPS